MVHFAPYVYKKPLEPSAYLPGIEDGKWKYINVEGRHLDEKKFDEWKTLYYEFEGWDPQTGWPTRKALEFLDEVIDQVRRHRNPQLRIAGIIPNRTTRTRLSAKIEADIQERYGSNVYPAVRENVRLAESGGFHAPIQIASPSSSGAVDFQSLTQTFLDRERPRPHRVAAQWTSRA